jgi:hypothetical protein
MNKLLLLFSLFLIITCSSEKPSDINRQKGENEKSASATSGLPASDSPSIGKSPSEAARNTVENNPPELGRVKIMPEVFKPDDRLYIDASGSDVDGDDVTIIYDWSINGESAGDSKEIGAQIKRGDKISVKITPYDGETYGSSITLNRDIGNMPPVITEDKLFVFDGKTYTSKIKASDPDGDDLSYSLKTAPDGMTIDSSGLIRWDVPPEFEGKAPVVVSVLDGNGGQATLNFDVKIKAAKR